MENSGIQRARPLLGTFVEISAFGAPAAELEAAVEAAFGAIAEVHRLMSFHEPSSDVSRVNRDAFAKAVEVDPWTFQVLETALELHRRSGGIFDITTAAALQRLGLLPDDAVLGNQRCGIDANPNPLLAFSTESAKRGFALACAGIDLLPNCRVRLQSADIRIDLGGIAKGFAVDCAIDILKERRIPAALVNAGGDLAAFGHGSHPIHIRDPRDPKRVLCEIELRGEALATSGPRFDPFHASEIASPAIIDPRTQTSAALVIGATVRAQTCMIADALTKLVMIAGEGASALLNHYSAKALMISSEAGVSLSLGFQGGLNYEA